MRRYFFTVLVLLVVLSPIVLGQDTPATPKQQKTGGDLQSMIIMFALIFGIFYILVIHPQKKKQRKHEERVNMLKTGDRVLAAGGIFGVCKGRNDKKGIVTLEIAKGVQIEISKNAVSTILSPEGEEVTSDPTRNKK